jgi:GNAT superfamily N-acetyltransferase
MRWFRQDDPLTLSEQKIFIFSDIENKDYNGQIILSDKVPVGLCAVKSTKEFSIAVLPEFQNQGIATKAMQQLIQENKGLWSEVFVGNPALDWYTQKFSFKIVCVKQNAYYKKDIGYIDIVRIQHD